MGKITKNSTILILKEVVLNLSSIFVIGYLARELGAEDYGKLTFSISFGIMLSIISNMGIRQYATREVVRHKDKVKNIHGIIVFTRFILALIMILVGLIIGFISNFNKEIMILVIIALVSKGFFAFTTTNYIVFEAFEDMKYNAITQTTARVFVIVFIVIVLLLGGGLYSIAIIYLLGDLGQYLISSFIIKKRYFTPVIIKSVSAAKEMVRNSVPFALFGIFSLIYFEVGKIMLFQLGSSKSVGIYQAASIFAFKALIVSDAVGTAIFPQIVSLKKSSLSKYRKLSLKAIGIMLLLGILSAFGIFLFSDLIISIVYKSNDYSESASLLRIIVWVLPLMFVTKILSYLMVASDHQKYLAIIYGIVVFSNALFNYILIPKYGAYGVAWALIFAEGIGTIIFILNHKKLALSKGIG